MLNKLLVEEIVATKTMMFEEMIADADLAPRPGLHDFVMEAFAAGVSVAVVTSGKRSWAEPLVRQLVGEGLIEMVVTADDVTKSMPRPRAVPPRLVGTRDTRGERARDCRFRVGAAGSQRRSPGHRRHHRRWHPRSAGRSGGAPGLRRR